MQPREQGVVETRSSPDRQWPRKPGESVEALTARVKSELWGEGHKTTWRARCTKATTYTLLQRERARASLVTFVTDSQVGGSQLY